MHGTYISPVCKPESSALNTSSQLPMMASPEVRLIMNNSNNINMAATS